MTLSRFHPRTFALVLALLLAACKRDSDDDDDEDPPPQPSFTFTGVNTALVSQNEAADTAVLSFDVAWPDSWRNDLPGAGRAEPFNYDAVWVLLKFQVMGGEWQHAFLQATGVSPPPGFAWTAPPDRRGLFLHRALNGMGDVSLGDVLFVWDYGASGVPDDATITARVFIYEMVFIPEGPFHAGDGTTGTGMDPTGQPLPVEGQFCQAGTTAPFLVPGEAPLMLGGTAATNLSSRNGLADDFNASTLQVLPAAFPKGFANFWLMKYELTCGQFVDWLSLLTPVQAAFVYPTPDPMGAERFGIVFQGGVYSTAVPARAVNWMNYEAVCSFGDWAALRPYTELEYEKACRGMVPAVPDEYSWGATGIVQITGMTGVDGSGMETATPGAANCQYNLTSGSLPGSAIQGPVSVGIFRRTHPGGTRQQQGRGYYGNFELTGNVWERPVTIHSVAARTFDGHPGDGALDASGRANEPTWPNLSGGGAGYRGANWFRGTAWARVSSRSNAGHDPGGRTSHRGIRVGRSYQ